MFKFFTEKGNPLPILYLIGFLYALHTSLTAYINSTFLAGFTGEQFVGVVYTVASFLAIFMISMFPTILHKFGNYLTFLIFGSIEVLVLLGLAFLSSSFLIAAIFVIYQVLLTLLFLNFDIFLESFSTNETTGSLRGTALTIMNVAFVIGPALTGFILTNGDFWRVYLIASLVILPVIFLTRQYFKDFVDPPYERVPFIKTLKRVLRDRNIRLIFLANYVLKFFYVWMVIYSPIYLNQHIGFDWSTIGIIFFVMLLPFIIFELPLGRIADKYLGEKEILTAGFIIMGGFTAALSFTTSTNPALWAFLLFGTRVGASFVEIMTETYFFKLVDGKDANIIGFFRNARPLAYITGPLAATIVLFFIDFRFLFLVLGIFVLHGVFYSLAIKDTK